MDDGTSNIISPPNWTDVLDLSNHFEDTRPLEVDVGCGKGRFLLARAEKSPDVNFLGIDRLLSRLRIIDKRIIRREIKNTKLLRIENSYAIQYLLPPQSVSTFYIFFPDPWPKKRHHKRRMFNIEFLNNLLDSLTDNGIVHIATDHLEYFKEIEELFENHTGFSKIEPFTPTEDERTGFEIIFIKQNLSIGRCSYQKQ